MEIGVELGLESGSGSEPGLEVGVELGFERRGPGWSSGEIQGDTGAWMELWVLPRL